MVSLARRTTIRFTSTSQHIVHRLQLGMQLIAAAQEAYPGQIRYHFNQQLEAVDFEAQQASFSSTHGQPADKHSYDLLIGADGANSRVRELLQVIYPPSQHGNLRQSETATGSKTWVLQVLSLEQLIWPSPLRTSACSFRGVQLPIQEI